ncbi:SSI family serine proteinase inhibitor [Streptomyces sp. NPDC052701]|uniref:SSI family serine proteinase inhibitor n=1 Tax=Streptomyces sp. NPDC052701 TaxID=3155533 RepID=UPI00341355E6
MSQVNRRGAPRPASRPAARPVLRRLVAGAAASVAAVASLSAAPPAASAAPSAGTPVPSARDGGRGDRDHLTVTVRGAGRGVDGTFELYCRPGGGSHPDPDGACGAVERNTLWGRDVFAPVPEGSVCTMQYGGSATARVTGTWAGRPVDATYDRSDGCEIDRWDRLVPLLPGIGSGAGSAQRR